MPYGATWSARVVAQASDSRLLYTEQLVGGGSDLLRGYQTNSILGDNGVIVSNEILSPPIRRDFKQMNESTPKLGRLQFLGFWDYGSIHDHRPDAGINVTASSIGSGARYALRNNVTAKFDYGWQLRSLPGVPGTGHLASFGIVLGN